MKVSRFIHDNRFRIFKTLIIYISYFCIGSAVTLLGSSLLDLQIRVNTNFSTISYLIPARSVGHIIGSGLAGILDRRFRHSLILFVNVFLSGIFIFLAPNFNDIKIVGTFLLFAGLAHGISDVTCNTLLTATWKEKSANWLQVLHMSWGVGSLLTPVICRPFLLPEQEEKVLIPTNGTTNLTATEITPIYKPEDVIVQYAYAIIAIITIIISLPYGYFYFKERSAAKILNKQNVSTKENPVRQRYSPLKVYTAVFIVALISHHVYSIETLVGSLGPSFAVKSGLHMEKKTGVLLTTVFWACFSFYRCLYIPMTFVFSETKLLLFNLCVATAGFLILVPWANYYPICIWTGFTLIGIGISPIFSAAYGMLAKHIIITSDISSVIFIPGVIGESIHPGIAAPLLDTNPVACLYYIGVAGLIFVVLFLALLVYCAKVFRAPLDLRHQQIAERSSIRSISRY